MMPSYGGGGEGGGDGVGGGLGSGGYGMGGTTQSNTGGPEGFSAPAAPPPAEKPNVFAQFASWALQGLATVVGTAVAGPVGGLVARQAVASYASPSAVQGMMSGTGAPASTTPGVPGGVTPGNAGAAQPGGTTAQAFGPGGAPVGGVRSIQGQAATPQGQQAFTPVNAQGQPAGPPQALPAGAVITPSGSVMDATGNILGTVAAGLLGNALGGTYGMAQGINAAGTAGAIQAAQASGNTLAQGAVGAANILAPAATEAAGIQANAATGSANTLSTAATQAAAGQAAAAQKAAQLKAAGYTDAAAAQIAGLTAAKGDLSSMTAQATANQQPYMNAGAQALQTLSAGLMPGGQFNKPFSMADAQNMPAYQFALQQGRSAIDSTAAAKGGALSSNAINAQTTFAEGTAAQYEQQAFNQWLAQNNLTLGALQNMVNTGQVSVQSLQSVLAQAGVSMATLDQNIGTANATGIQGAANANATGVTDSAGFTAGGVKDAANAQAAGQTGAAKYTAGGVVDSAAARAAGVSGAASGIASGDTAVANILSGGAANAATLAAQQAGKPKQTPSLNLPSLQTPGGQIPMDTGSTQQPISYVPTSGQDVAPPVSQAPPGGDLGTGTFSDGSLPNNYNDLLFAA